MRLLEKDVHFFFASLQILLSAEHIFASLDTFFHIRRFSLTILILDISFRIHHQTRRSTVTMCLFVNLKVTSNFGLRVFMVKSVPNLYWRKIADNITFIVNIAY